MSHAEILYTPGQLPDSDENLRQYLEHELQVIATAILQSTRVPIFYEEPHFSEEGQLARADGIGWDPNSGVGLYIFTGGSWVFIV
jgi:hypothetical protein